MYTCVHMRRPHTHGRVARCGRMILAGVHIGIFISGCYEMESNASLPENRGVFKYRKIGGFISVCTSPACCQNVYRASIGICTPVDGAGCL
jgi:hypothetical protein